MHVAMLMIMVIAGRAENPHILQQQQHGVPVITRRVRMLLKNG